MKQKTLKIVILFFCVLTSHLASAEVTTATIDGLVYSLSGTQATIINYTNEMSPDLVIPESIIYDGDTYKVTCIGNRQWGSSSWGVTGAFYKCSILKSIVIPSSVTNIIGEYESNPDNAPDLDGQVFYGCSNLEKVIFQGSTSIGSNAFYGCSALKTLIFNKSITIGECAFWNCTSLKYVVFPSGTRVSSNAFKGCNKLQDIIWLGEPIYSLGVTNVNYYTVSEFVSWDQHSYTYSGTNPTMPSYVNNMPRGFIPIVNGNVVLQKEAGSYTTNILFTFTNEDMSFAVDIPYNYTINPIPLTARVKDATRTYGDANPQFQTEYTGFISGEDESVITNVGTYSTSATAKSDVGTYIVSLAGASAQNYTFIYEPGTLTVTKAPLTMTARDKTMDYGGRVPTLEVDYSGLKNNESKPVWTSEPTVSTTATSTSNAGTYPITISGGVAKNYDVTFKRGTLTINKATLTATTIDATREYGDADPQFEIKYSGLKNGETAPDWVVSPTIVSPATKLSPVGEYTITATGGEARNYTLQYQNSGKLTVSKAPLTAKARSYSRKQGEANPTFAIDYSGFKNGETKSVLIREPMASTTATRASGIGTYPITVGGGEALNYDFIYVNGTLTIGEAEQLLTANTLNLQSLTVNKGTQAELKISLANENQITGLQFDLYLPQGVSVATNSKGKMLISTTERMDGSYSITGSDMGSYVRIVGYSADSDPFTGKSGDILTITLDVASTMADGNYNFQLRDIVLSDVYNTEFHPADVSATMTVKSYTLGDVDNSGAININDVVCIINHILNKSNGVFIREAADVDGSGAININDVVTLINRFILKKSSAPRKAPRLVAMTDDNYMSLATIDIKPGETKEVALLLNNQNEVKAVQGNLKLPAGLTFVTKSNGRLDVKNNNSRSEDFTLSCALQDDGSMTFAHYSADGFAYDGNEGGIFIFKIKADENAAPGSYEVKLSEMVLSIEGVAYEEADRTCPLNITSTNGISEITIDDSSQVYTLDGLKVSGKPTKPGVYIRNGRKFVVK